LLYPYKNDSVVLAGSGLIEHTHEQVQCMAVPADPSDPLLREWVKVPQNPILKRPPSVGLHDFRDPSTAWQQSDGTWIFTVGAKVGDIGLALQYRSTDLKNWEFLEEKLLHSGPAVGMWECVDFFPVDYDTPTRFDTQKYVFKISLYDVHIDYYTIGTYDEAAHKFIPDHQELDIGIGFHLDYGKYYASKSFFDPVKKRRIMWAWVPESCTQEMDLQKGWSSLQVRCPCPPMCSFELQHLRIGKCELGEILGVSNQYPIFHFCREYQGQLHWTARQA
jgi:beta-fructofuranosidase